jgi:hypothetical protein
MPEARRMTGRARQEGNGHAIASAAAAANSTGHRVWLIK